MHPRGDLATFGRFEAAFDAAIAPWRVEGPPVCVLFSGGVDSGLIAWELRHRRGTRLFTIGRPGSPDLVAAEGSSELVGLPWTGREVRPEDLERARLSIAPESDALPPTARSIALSLAVAVQEAPAGELLCGQGADELFLGYAHFASLDPVRAEERAREDLQRLIDDDWPRTRRIAHRLGRRIHAPWLHPEFVAGALAVPLDLRMPRGAPKGFWRDFARGRGLPAEIANRPKRALQYGTGIDRWVRHTLGPAP